MKTVTLNFSQGKETKSLQEGSLRMLRLTVAAIAKEPMGVFTC